MNYLMIAHGNNVSYYDMANKKWMGHINFALKQDSDGRNIPDNTSVAANLNETYNHLRNKKVIKVFRHEASAGSFNIGVLFQDGSFELLILKTKAGSQFWVRESSKKQTKGTIVNVCCDLEHYRILYILTLHNGSPQLYGFTEGELYPLTPAI